VTPPKEVKFRIYAKVQGGHTWLRVFAGKGETLGKAGDLTFRNEEWAELEPKLRSVGIEIR
jgi:hypothetical protein